MANSIKFDRDQVIDKAQRLFWQRGFNGTSMRDLLQTVNLRPGSLYASFGDKETLYHDALQKYAEQGRQFLAQCQANTATPIAALQLFVRSQVLHTEQAPSQVCMLVKTVAELSVEGSGLALLAKKLLADMELAFRQLLQQAQAQGIQLSAPPERLSKVLQAQIIGLKTYAQTQPDKAVLAVMVEDVLATLLQK